MDTIYFRFVCLDVLATATSILSFTFEDKYEC